jgi:3-hydroxyisobutyrate dehydrogenase
MKVGMIGLGAMGLGMARNLAKAGLLTAVYNRTTAKTLEFKVATYDLPEALAAEVDIVLICVSADQDVIGLVESIAKTIKPGSIVVDLSTVSSDTAQKAAAILLKKEVNFLDAPVSGGVEGAKNGTLAMMVGGNIKALEKARPALEVIAKRIIHIGDTGSGQATKAANQIMCAGD